MSKFIAMLTLFICSVFEDFAMRHINTTTYVILSSIIPTSLIVDYMEKFKVIFCVRGVISPLLSNIVLDELDKELEKRGHKFVRYADDFRIYCKSLKAAQRVKTSITKFLTGTLRLKVNEEKSAVSRP
ncbi:MAG: reverse transcriptase domain-containing protein, partial [Desulfatitalea sp.]